MLLDNHTFGNCGEREEDKCLVFVFSKKLLHLKGVPGNRINIQNPLNLRTKQSDYKVITKLIIDDTKSCALIASISKDYCLFLVRGDGQITFSSSKYVFTKYLLREGWCKEQVFLWR